MKHLILAAATIALVPTMPSAGAQKAGAASSAPSTQTASAAEFDKQLAVMRDYMAQMQVQMDKIAQTQDPQERQRLLQEHWTSMQAAMSVMHGMWGPNGAMMGCCGGASAPGAMMGRGMMMGPGMMGGPMMGWGHMRGYYDKLTPEQIRQRQYMMDQYLPMQQMMMDHMMWHQRWTTQPPAPSK